MKKTLRLSVVSDIHLGHRRNRAEFIIKNLNKCLTNDQHMASIDLLVLAGDVFDTLLELNSEDVPHIKAWIARLLRLAHKYKVIVRILEGTPSHDRAQSYLFEAINEIHEKNADKGVNLKWVRTLSVEHIGEFDAHLLYVPDEWRPDTATTLEEAREAIAQAGLAQVDVAIMHGQFRYQLPEVAVRDSACHNEQAYIALTKYLIFVGHVHIHSRFDTIVAQGSFDRLAHGEEGPKGFVTAILEPDGSSEVIFVENVGARRFVSVFCPYEEVEENLKLIDAACESLPSDSFVRVKAAYANPILSNMDVLRSRWPLLQWTPPKVEDNSEANDAIVVPTMTQYIPITIDRHNLKDLVMSRLDKLNLDAALLARCDANLTEMQQL